MEAIILVGGLGTRLSSVIKDVPKPMAPVLDKPFLYYILMNLKRYKFSKVVLAVGYLKDVIINYFGFEFEGMKIVYSIEDAPLGTGGAIKQALTYTTDEYVFVINGDTYYDVDYKSIEFKGDMVIVCRYSFDINRYGSVVISDGLIIDFDDRKRNSGFINGGIYLINRSIFDDYKLECFSFENDFIKKKIKEIKAFPYISNTYFIDIGTPNDYYKFIEDVKNEQGIVFR